MRTFDWALFELYNAHAISFEEAIRNADSANELRLHIKLKSERGEPPPSDFMALEIEAAGPTPEQLEEQRHQEMLKQQETRRRLEDAQLEQLREKKRLAEAAANAR
jgi:twitching motility protein PilU